MLQLVQPVQQVMQLVLQLGSSTAQAYHFHRGQMCAAAVVSGLADRGRQLALAAPDPLPLLLHLCICLLPRYRQHQLVLALSSDGGLGRCRRHPQRQTYWLLMLQAQKKLVLCRLLRNADVALRRIVTITAMLAPLSCLTLLAAGAQAPLRLQRWLQIVMTTTMIPLMTTQLQTPIPAAARRSQAAAAALLPMALGLLAEVVIA